MSGSLRVLPVGTPPLKHDHVDLNLDSGRMLRLNDPRRFGAMDLMPTAGAETHKLLASKAIGNADAAKAFKEKALKAFPRADAFSSPPAAAA